MFLLRLGGGMERLSAETAKKGAMEESQLDTNERTAQWGPERLLIGKGMEWAPTREAGRPKQRKGWMDTQRDSAV